YQLLADSEKIWILDASGLCYYLYADNHFHYLDFNKNANLQVTSIIMDKKQTIWFTTTVGLSKIDIRSLKYSLVKQDSELAGGALYIDVLQRIWINKINKLYLYDPQKESLTSMPNLQLSDIGFITGFFSQRENEIWMAFKNYDSSGLRMYNKSTTQTHSFYKNNAISIHEHYGDFMLYPFLTGDSVLWCNNDKGIALFNLKTKKFIPTGDIQKTDETSLDVGEVNVKFIDRENNLWIGGSAGLAKTDVHTRQINSYRIAEMFEKSAAVSIRKMVKDKYKENFFWIITYGAGILKYDFKKREVVKWYRYVKPEKNKEDENGSWNYDACYDKHGKLWVASGIGLSSYEEKKDEFVNQQIVSSVKPGANLILKMIMGASNDLWLGTNEGLYRYDTKTLELKRINKLNQINNIKSEENLPVYDLKFNSNGQLVVGTKKGLKILDTSSGNIKTLFRNQAQGFILDRNYVWGVDTDKDGNVWAATYGGSLWRWNKSNNSYTDFAVKNGLTNTIFRDVYVDSLQNIWTSSKDGVFKLPAGDTNFIHYTPTNGLFDIDQSQGRWSIIDHKIFAGYNGGFSIIDLYHKKLSQASFPVWISGFKIFDDALYFEPGRYRNNTLQLKPSQNFISFEFTGLYYTQAENIKYAYKLEGADKDWINIGRRRFVTYSNLAAGDYTMLLKAMNSEGQWSSQEDSFKFYLAPVFWKSWWFRILLLAFMAIAIIGLFRYKLATVKKDAIFRQRIAETEMIALRTQLNPHFIFNSLSSIENLMMRNNQRLAIEYLNKFAMLLRIILESSRTPVVPFSKDMEAIKLYVELEHLRLNKSFSFSINITADLQNGDYKVPPLLIQPFVENAIIHGLAALEKNDGMLAISASLSGDMLHYVIMDNGIGQRKAAMYKAQNKNYIESIGVKLSEERIHNFNEQQHAEGKLKITDLYDEEGNSSGTQVDITIKAI
ncbi:MAG: histidine kinase, partial [Ferruginibacter sp.]